MLSRYYAGAAVICSVLAAWYPSLWLVVLVVLIKTLQTTVAWYSKLTIWGVKVDRTVVPRTTAEPGAPPPQPVATDTPRFNLFSSTPENEPSDKVPFWWRKIPHTSIMLRGPNYFRDKKKTPSMSPFYDIVGADIFKAEGARVDSVLSKIKIPFEMAPEISATWGVPRVLIVNAMIPGETGPCFVGEHPSHDLGYNAIGYFFLSSSARKMLSDETPSPAMKLWQEFCKNPVVSKDGSGFSVKGILKVSNIDDISGVPDVVKKLNGKPLLITRSATVRVDGDVLEITYDIRKFTYLARVAINSLIGERMSDFVIDVGYLMESKTDEFLPEQLLGCVQVCHLNPLKCLSISLS